MKVSRSYWLGLGSGFILSAMLAVVIVPLQGQALNTNISQTNQTNQSQTLQRAQIQTPSSGTPTKTQDSLSSSSADSNSIERNFVIPQGASLERIADQLAAQGLFKNKTEFLSVAHQMGVETKFKAGTFRLSPGLTSKELIYRLLKS